MPIGVLNNKISNIYNYIGAITSLRTGTDFSQKLDELLKLDRDHKELSTKKVIDSYDAVHLGKQ